MSDDRVHIFGIRHHGPGSARSLERALEQLQPDCLLIEGPPDGEPVLSLAAHAEMRPPVALLIYNPDEPRRAAFYPFAEYSPEWRAMQYGLRAGIPLRMIDLPLFHQLAEEASQESLAAQEAETSDQAPPGDADSADEDSAAPPLTATSLVRRDPLGLIAEAAGFSDGERWWDWFVESRRSESREVFVAVREAMTALREAFPVDNDLREQRREAHMRKAIRAALKEHYERIAIVCGAWHAPALLPSSFPTAAQDNSLLSGLKKIKTEAAWSPWTYDRLAVGSGYGAGVVSPAWYDLLWSDEQHVAVRWMARVAQLLRDNDLETSSAHVIEAVRLSESLAAMRERPMPGLEELSEAALAVVCEGQEAPLRLIRRKLVIGERLGSVPADAPMAPLERDLAATQKRLRLPAKTEIKQHDFDLRKPMDLARSQLLHRLNLLEIPWGTQTPLARGAKGTFHELWQVQWQPEFIVQLIEASRYGNTIEAAATARTAQAATDAVGLAKLTELLDQAMLAELPVAVAELITAIQQRASTASDVPQLMQAVPALARVMRYGTVRQTDASLVGQIVSGIVERICIGLPGACLSLADDAAAELFEQVLAVHGALATLQDEALLERWFATLYSLATHDRAHHLLQGRAARLVHDAGRARAEKVGRWMSLALSPGTNRAAAAAWVEGFLRGSGLILIHDATLWRLLEQWIAELDGEAFTELLPLLRRTFSTFEVAERRQMGQRVKSGTDPASIATPRSAGFCHDRAAQVLPLIAQLLGVEEPR